MDNASDEDLKQVVEDPADAPLVEAAGDELESNDGQTATKRHDDAHEQKDRD
jgi:hypothetical protein